MLLLGLLAGDRRSPISFVFDFSIYIDNIINIVADATTLRAAEIMLRYCPVLNKLLRLYRAGKIRGQITPSLPADDPIHHKLSVYPEMTKQKLLSSPPSPPSASGCAAGRGRTTAPRTT